MKELYFEETFPTSQGMLDVDVKMGRVEIVPHDGRTVTISAQVENADVIVTRSDNTVHVKSEHGRKATNGSWLERLLNGSFNTKVILTIHVPDDCEIQANVVTGRLSISGINASVTARVMTGDLSLSDIGGPVYAKTVTGQLRYDGILINASHRFETTTGQISLCLPKEPNALLDASAMTGHVQCDFPLSQSQHKKHLTGGKLRGTLGSGEGSIKAKVVTGSFQLKHA
ncbi:MAG TPA: DUF4097 family beta strand repeat-containing protein [Chloroflexota bacterium]|nr:DUF4097 family beta strand repeat-containing protein [Chloroflexota bacterium]HUM72212.1 DUF4097 family beta strand repeat-containing protein [Chloroflexota bacterium]